MYVFYVWICFAIRLKYENSISLLKLQKRNMLTEKDSDGDWNVIRKY